MLNEIALLSQGYDLAEEIESKKAEKKKLGDRLRDINFRLSQDPKNDWLDKHIRELEPKVKECLQFIEADRGKSDHLKELKGQVWGPLFNEIEIKSSNDLHVQWILHTIPFKYYGNFIVENQDDGELLRKKFRANTFQSYESNRRHSFNQEKVSIYHVLFMRFC